MMTDYEVFEALKRDTPLNRARMQFSAASARIEQAEGQMKPPTIVQIRRMEFEAVTKIAAALGYDIT